MAQSVAEELTIENCPGLSSDCFEHLTQLPLRKFVFSDLRIRDEHLFALKPLLKTLRLRVDLLSKSALDAYEALELRPSLSWI